MMQLSTLGLLLAVVGLLQVPGSSSITPVSALDLMAAANPSDFRVAMEMKEAEEAVQVVADVLATEHRHLPLGSVDEVSL
jgi:hypothetical protein